MAFQIGTLTLPNNTFYSSLAGCSDYPFRKMAVRHRPGLVFCEMVKIDPLVRLDFETFRLLDFDKDMHPIGAQICGSDPKLAGEAAKIIEDLGFDLVDLNCGCPVDKITRDGCGSAMLKNPERIGEMLAEMVAAVRIPVTVKIRVGWDEKTICAPEITCIAEEAGAAAIAVHGRTRQQGYRGKANWGVIKDCVEVAKKIKVIGNGDLFHAEDVLKRMEETGCDAVLVSRGTLGQPWIAEDVRLLAKGLDLPKRNFRRALLDHLEFMIAYETERRVIINMRRIGCWYLKGRRSRDFRAAITRVESLQEIREIIDKFMVEEAS